jgi:hypothetical protein
MYREGPLQCYRNPPTKATLEAHIHHPFSILQTANEQEKERKTRVCESHDMTGDWVHCYQKASPNHIRTNTSAPATFTE